MVGGERFMIRKYTVIWFSFICFVVMGCLEWSALKFAAQSISAKGPVVLDPKWARVYFGPGKTISYYSFLLTITLLCFLGSVLLTWRVRDSWRPVVVFQTLILGSATALLLTRFLIRYLFTTS